MSSWHLKLVFVGASIVGFCSPVFAATAEQLVEKAKILEKDGCSAEAITYLDQAIAKGAKRPGVLWLRGYCHQAIGHHQAAIADFSKGLTVVEKQKNNVITKQNLLSSRGASYMALKQDDKALDDFSQSLVLNNALPTIHVSRGNIYLRMKQYQRAIDDYSAALRLRVVLEDKGRVLLSRAKAYEALGKYNMAKIDHRQIKEIEKAFDIDGNISLHKR